MPFFDLYEKFGQLTDPALKSAIALSKIDYSISKGAFTNIKTIQQSTQYEPFGVCTARNNFATKVTDKVMTYLFQGGISQYLFDYLLNFEFKKLLDEETGPKVLSVNDLEFGFITWLIACAACICGFMLEILWYFVTVKLPILIENLAFLLAIVCMRKKILRLY